MPRIVFHGFLVSAQDPFAVKAMHGVDAKVLSQSTTAFGFCTMSRADFPLEPFMVYEMHPITWPKTQCWLGWRMLVRNSSCSEEKAYQM